MIFGKDDVILDSYVQRLQNMSEFEVYAITSDGKLKPWYKVNGSIVADLVIREVDLAAQVQTVAAQIAHWGRMAAQCKRVWEIEERLFRQWKAQQSLDLAQPPQDEDAKKVWKKPSEALTEATYRVHPEYAVGSMRVERAEEAYNSALALVEAFRAKREMLRVALNRAADQISAP